MKVSSSGYLVERISFHVPSVLLSPQCWMPHAEGLPGFTTLGRSQQLPEQGRMVAPGENVPPAPHPQDSTPGWGMEGLGLCVGGSWGPSFGGYWESAAPNPAVPLAVVTGAAQSLVLHPPHRFCLPLLAPCHNTVSPSPPVQRQGLPLSPALPASPCAAFSWHLGV